MNTSEFFAKVEKRVTDYKTDIDHDRHYLAVNPNIPVIHFARDWGTHLLPLVPLCDLPLEGVEVKILFGKGGRNTLLKNVSSMMEWFVKHDYEYHYDVHYYNGDRWTEINIGQAMGLVSTYLLHIALEIEEETRQ